MATVTGLTAAKALELASQDIIDGEVSGDDLLLTRRDGTTFVAGNVRGPQGIPGTLSIAEKPPADLPSTYTANAVSVFDFASTAGWPTTNATVMTVNEGTSRIFQMIVSKTDDDIWFRTGNANVWGAFKKMASKTYVDTQDALSTARLDYLDGVTKGIELAGSVNLNTLTTPGVWLQSQDSEAASGTNYPVALAGILEVNAVAAGTLIIQTYTPFSDPGSVYRRSYISSAWGSWKTYAALSPSMPASTTSAASGTSTSGTTETRDAVLGNYAFTALAGHWYRAVLDNAAVVATTAADQFGIRIRNGGASTPTASSTMVANTRAVVHTTGVALPITLAGKFQPGAGVQTLSVFVVRLGAGSGTSFVWGADLARALYVIDLGV